MLIKRCLLIFVAQFVSILVVTQAHAQLSPGIQQSGPVQLDPKAQQRQDLRRQLDRRPPGTPTLIAPTEEAILQIQDNQPARVLFRWQTGPGAPADRYKLCLFEAVRTCEQPGSEIYTIPLNAQQFDAVQGLPRGKFLGKSLRWSVAACRDVLVLASPPSGTMQPPIKEICTVSAPRLLYWPLAPPKPDGFSITGESAPGVPIYDFFWEGSVRARAYLFCLFEGLINSCTNRTTLPDSNPLVIDKAGPRHTITHDLTQFRGRTVQWTAAACTHVKSDDAPTSPLPEEFRCTWQRQPSAIRSVHVVNRVLPPTINPIEISGLTTPGDEPQPIQMRWTLNRSQDVKSVKICVLTAQGPRGASVEPEQRGPVLTATPSTACNQRNVIENPIRERTKTSCTFRRPLLHTGSSSSTVFGFAVAACNEQNWCAWSSPLVVIQEYKSTQYGPLEFGSALELGTRAICE